MTDDELDALYAQIELLRKQRAPSEFGSIPASIGFLQSVLAGELSEEDRLMVYALLVSQCSRARNDALHEDIVRRRAREFPADPMSQAGMASTLAVIKPSGRAEALRVAKKALNLAKAQDRLVRYCATNLARIAMMLDDGDALRTALLELVDDAGRERAEDTGFEFDFVDRIDPSRCGAELLARYKALRL